MKKLIIFATIVLLSLLFINCGSDKANSQTVQNENDTTSVVQKESGHSEKTENPKDRQANKDRNNPETNAVPVEVTSLTRGAISSFLLYSSTLETEQQVDVVSRIEGIVEDIYVDESDFVKKGQKLLQIEAEEYKLAEEKAQIDYEKQKTNFNRVKALQEKDLLSEEEFENARLSLKQAEIAWKQAKLNLKYTTVTSPITGQIGNRFVRLGQHIQPNMTLFTVANFDEKIVVVYVPQDEFSQCYKNQPAIITADALEDQQFEGYVKRKSPVIDPQSGTFKVTVAVEDPQDQLRPGMFVNTQLIVDTHEDALLLPKAALIYENERSYFFTVQNDSAIKVELKKGFEDARKVEILNDLPVGSRVVVLGQNGLKDGTKVKIIDEKTYAWQLKPQAFAKEQPEPETLAD